MNSKIRIYNHIFKSVSLLSLSLKFMGCISTELVHFFGDSVRNFEALTSDSLHLLKQQVQLTEQQKT